MPRQGGGGRRNGGGGKRKGTPLRRRARRDINVAFAPQLNAIEREQSQAANDADRYRAQIQALYGGLGNELGRIGGQFDSQLSGISSQFGGDISTLAGFLSSNTPGGEQAAASGLLGNLGAGGLSVLAANQARNVGYNTSAQRQGAVENTVSQRNVLEDLEDFMRAARERQFDVREQMTPAILSRLDELRDRRFEQTMSKKDLALRRAALAAQTQGDAALLRYYRDLLNDGKGKGNGKGKGKDDKKGGRRNDPRAENPPRGGGQH